MGSAGGGPAASARARARIDVTAIVALGPAAEHRLQRRRERVKRIKKDDWEGVKDEISKPPSAARRQVQRLVKLGKLLREHGFAVAENAEMGDYPRRRAHRRGLPLQVPALRGARRQADNGAGSEKSLIDGIVADVQKLGFRTIWQAAGHFDHIHIDIANSGRSARRRHGGAVGALEETGLDVKLIDWEAEYTPFGGFGGLYAAAAPTAARRPMSGARHCAPCWTATNASPKVRLSAFETAIVESGVHNLTVRRPRLARASSSSAHGPGWGTRRGHGPRHAAASSSRRGDRATTATAGERRSAGAGRAELRVPGSL